MDVEGVGRLSQEYCKFKVSLGYLARPCLKTKRQVSIGYHVKGRAYSFFFILVLM